MAIEVNENLASKLQEALQEKTVAVNQFKNADTLLAEVVAEKQEREIEENKQKQKEE